MKYIQKPVAVEAVKTFEASEPDPKKIFNETPDWLIRAFGDNKLKFVIDRLPGIDEPDSVYAVIQSHSGVMKVTPGNWIVREPSGEIRAYTSEQFDRSFNLDCYPDTFDFGLAIKALKEGKRVARKGWNDKGMFLFLLPGGNPQKSAIHDPALRAVIDQHCEGDTFPALPSVRMWTADHKVLTGWLASQTDMLSEDWEVVA